MSRTPRRLAIGFAGLWALSSPFGPASHADEPTGDRAVVPAALTSKRDPVPLDTRRPVGPGSRGESASGWWLGPVGIAAAFAVVGGASLASRRFNLNLGLGLGREAGIIGVLGQARLSPKHSVHLVRVGGRVLILGTGAGGSPTTLGEVTDPAELARLLPPRTAAGSGRTASAPAIKLPPDLGRTTGFDRRIGADE